MKNGLQRRTRKDKSGREATFLLWRKVPDAVFTMNYAKMIVKPDTYMFAKMGIISQMTANFSKTNP